MCRHDRHLRRAASRAPGAARAAQGACARGGPLPAVVLTFEPTPREYLAAADPPARLTSLRERWRILDAVGLDYLWVLRFGEALRNLTAEDFAQLLVRELRTRRRGRRPRLSLRQERCGHGSGAGRSRRAVGVCGRRAAGRDARRGAHQQQRRARRRSPPETSPARAARSAGRSRCAAACAPRRASRADHRVPHGQSAARAAPCAGGRDLRGARARHRRRRACAGSRVSAPGPRWRAP